MNQMPTQWQLLEAAAKYNGIALVAEFLEVDIVGALQPLPVFNYPVKVLCAHSLKGQFLEVDVAIFLMTALA